MNNWGDELSTYEQMVQDHIWHEGAVLMTYDVKQ